MNEWMKKRVNGSLNERVNYYWTNQAIKGTLLNESTQRRYQCVLLYSTSKWNDELSNKASHYNKLRQDSSSHLGGHRWPKPLLALASTPTLPLARLLFPRCSATVNWFSARKQTITSQWAEGTLNEYSLDSRRQRRRTGRDAGKRQQLQEIIHTRSWAIVAAARWHPLCIIPASHQGRLACVWGRAWRAGKLSVGIPCPWLPAYIV